MRKLRVVLMISALAGCGGLERAEGRKWTDKFGRSFEGEAVKVTESYVYIRMNGKESPVPLKNLSANDLSHLKRMGKASALSGVAKRSETTRGTAVRLSGTFKPKVPEMTAKMNLPVKMVENDPVKSRWVYRSPHFEFISDSYLSIAAVRSFSWIFEVTHDYVATLPLQLPRARDAGKRPLRTYLFSTREAYFRAGAPRKSAGVYLPGRDAILIPFSSLGLVKTTGGYQVRNQFAYRVLQHEITHHLMRGETQQAGWFIEGVAEYVACVPFHHNRLLLSHHQGSVVKGVVGTGWENTGGYQLGRSMTLPPLGDFLRSDYQRFQQTKNSYPYALMAFYYFARLEGKKDGARLKRYSEMLLEGRLEHEAREALWGGRTDEQLAADFAKAWNLLGITVKF